jgi:hypothetical protein
MAQEGRTAADDDRMMHAAHASRYHWGQAPGATPAHLALARAHAIAGDAGQAREYTDQALAAARDIAEDEERELVLADLETIPGQPRYW